MFAAWCLMLDAWGLRLEAWCLMLDGWCLNTCQTHPQRDPQRGGGRRPPPLCGGGRRPPPFVDGSGRCSSIKHQASSIKHQASSIKHQASSICFVTNQHTTEVEAFLTRQISNIFRHASSRFSDFPFQKCWVWEVWYYQSGPKSVSINPYGIPEPPNH